ncbi:unnamed protein product [Lampetra planeri]
MAGAEGLHSSSSSSVPSLIFHTAGEGSGEGAGREAEVSGELPGQPESETARMDVFLMIRRHKTTIFTDAKESTTVLELKRMVGGIVKRSPADQRLYKETLLLDDSKTLGDCGFTSQTARAQAPATVGLAFRSPADEEWEALRLEPYSSPPELPDVMKPQDGGGSSSSSNANEQTVQ